MLRVIAWLWRLLHLGGQRLWWPLLMLLVLVYSMHVLLRC